MVENEHIVLKPIGSGGHEQPSDHRAPPVFFPRLLDQHAKIKTISGAVIDCKIKGFNNYEILAEIGNGEHILIFKHAILFISSDALKPKPRPEKAGGDAP